MAKELDLSPVNKIKSLSNIIDNKMEDVLWVAGGGNVGAQQLWVLCYIYFSKASGIEIYQKDIEQYFDIRRPTASKILKEMEAGGYLHREVDELDSRRRKIVLSEKAVTFIRSRESLLEDFSLKLMDRISKREIKVFMDVLFQMRENLERIRSIRKPALR